MAPENRHSALDNILREYTLRTNILMPSWLVKRHQFATATEVEARDEYEHWKGLLRDANIHGTPEEFHVELNQIMETASEVPAATQWQRDYTVNVWRLDNLQ